MSSRFFALLLASVALGCGGAAEETARPTTPAGQEKVIETPATPSGPTTLRRSRLREAIAQGLGVFLQNVSVDDYPVMKDGRFYGFRIRSINTEWGLDLRPGDVVTKVNGMSIERPEEADAAMRSLEKASTVRVDFEREGKARTLDVPIVDDSK